MRRFTEILLDGLLRLTADQREADLVIPGDGGAAYLLRWHVIPKNPVFGIYLHLFLQSDDARALHDHRYVNASLLLEGSYVEHTIRAGGVEVARRMAAGALRVRLPWTAHRIALDAGPCWSLFLCGPGMRDWGFHCPAGWKPWRAFLGSDDYSSRGGPGCGA